MSQSLTPLSPSNGGGAASALSTARFASPPPQSSPSASTGSRGSRSSRSKCGGSSVARRRFRRVLDNRQKNYAPHVCRFAPYRPPAAVMLDPFPSLRINGICMAGLATLVTVHRSGVRLYRERHFSPVTTLAAPQQLTSSAPLHSLTTLRSAPATVTATTAAAPAAPTAALPRGVSTASGVFEQLEARCDFQVRESYLCSAMQPVLMDRAVLLSRSSRYFCVASGSDRVVHSVAVMSSGAHFCLHHERHQTNKVVCLYCTQVATEPFHPAVLKPAVASVDEVGSVVLFDVEREVPAMLEKAPLWYRQVKVGGEGVRARESGDGDAAAAQPPRQSPLLDQHLSPEEEDHVLDVMERVPLKERATYHDEHGVATRVTLVGPCLELCNHCHNAFMSLAASRGYIMVSIYISSRARDVPTTDDATEGPRTGDGNHSNNHASAELNVVLLRVLWGPRRAFVLEEVRLVQEAAPTDVCEAGVATAARPYQVGLPSTLLLARPGLALWQLYACTGQRIDTRRIYPLPTAGGGKDSRNGGGGGAAVVPPRLASEFIIHWVPLGRHRLTTQQDDHVGPQSWFCIAAVTDDDTVLLLGRAPQSCRTSLSDTAPPLRPSPGTSTERVTEKFKDANLEGWLDDLSASPPAPSPPAEASKASITMDSTTTTSDTPYTVLMKLYSPSGTSAAAASVAAGVVSVMPDLHGNRLLLFMADEEALLSVPLPFAERIATLTDSEPPQEEENGRDSASKPVGESGPSPTNPSVDLHAAAEAMASNGYSQYLWGATSAAVTAASQGWSSSVQRWAPASSSYFSFTTGNGGGDGGVASSPLASSTPPNVWQGTSRDATHTPAPAVEQPYRPFSLTRPLMAAVFHLAGEEGDPPNTQISKTTLRPAANAAAATAMAKVGAAETTGGAFTPPPAAFTGVQPTSPVPVQPPSRHRRASLEPRSISEEASTSVAATAVSTATTTATTIRFAHGDRERSGSRATSRDNRQSAHRRPHHRVPSSASLSEYAEESDGASTRGGGHRRRRQQHQQWGRGNELPAVVEVDGAFTAATHVGAEDGTEQAFYMEQQMTLLTQPQDQAGDNVCSSAGKGRGTAPRTLEEAQFLQRRLVDVEEPLERNMLLYSWKDGHNDLYIRLCVGLDALEQTAAAAAATKSPAASAKVRSPRGHRPASQVDALSLVTHTSADVAYGVHSVGFLDACHASASWRTSTASYGNCFHFADYFATLQVPQHLLDLQERDKCRLELEDLRMQQKRDMAAVHPFAWMTIYQNEERRSAEAEWRLHATFPYDDETDGRAVDINKLNRTACTHRETVAGAPAWRWATTKEACVWAEEEEGKGQHGTATRRVQSLVRELKDWSVGPWEYAERWPPSHGNNTGSGGASSAAAFAWCSNEAPSHRCRRRRLTRLRVNVDELRRQAQLTESHIRELNALREELGL